MQCSSHRAAQRHHAAQAKPAGPREDGDVSSTMVGEPGTVLDPELHKRANDNAAAMLFVELLFWTPARMSEEVRDVYCWEVGSSK